MKQKRVLKRWVKNLLWVVLGAIIGISIYQLFTITSIHTTPAGSYECKGGIVKVCSGSKKVANYLGV